MGGSAAEQDEALCDGYHQQRAEQEDHEAEREQRVVDTGHPWEDTSIDTAAAEQGQEQEQERARGGACRSRSIAWSRQVVGGFVGECEQRLPSGPSHLLVLEAVVEVGRERRVCGMSCRGRGRSVKGWVG